jgi:hypothetical protein
VIRTDKADATTNEEATAIWRITVKDPDAEKAGRAFANAVAQLALSSIPGFYTLEGAPSAGQAFGVYEPACVPAEDVPQEVVVLGGEAREVSSVAPRDKGDATARVKPAEGPKASTPSAGGSTRHMPLGAIVGARSGDKGGNANLGVFVRSDEAWAWLDGFLTTERLQALLPEVEKFQVDRHRFPALRSLNFVVHGILEEGVAAAARQDGQAKSLGEWLRSRVVAVPEVLVA